MRFIRENLSLIAAIVGAIAVLTAGLLKADEKFVYSIIFLVAILIVLLTIFVKSYLTANNDQNILYSFITDSLLPNKSKKFLGIKTDIAILGAEENKGIVENFRNQFINTSEMKITPIICDSSEVELQKGDLRDRLSGVEAVIVVRTKELENKSWAYEVLEEWAFQNSHVACLVIDKIDPKELAQLKLSPIPEKYFFVPDDKGSLPWRLLKRANERALAWRHQASFNRLIAISVFILLLTGLMSNYFMSSLHEKEYYGLLQRSYEEIAKQTKARYEHQVLNGIKDESLHVSYWFRHSGTLYQLSSTDKRSARRTYTEHTPSVISCGFFIHPNSSVWWAGSQTSMLSFNGEKSDLEGGICKFDPDPYRHIKSIICTTYNGSKNPENPEDTVGICVFTQNETNIFNNYSPDFLKERTSEFYDFVSDFRKDKKLIPQ
jgi:hypothetical protein